MAKQIQAPVFHVNADDPESVVQAARVAMEFRQRFKVDVIIDMWCYRRYGHNEADDPTLTQPLMYQQIAQHASTLKLYTAQLVEEQRIELDQVNELHDRARGRLDEAQEVAKKLQVAPRTATFGGVWQGLSWATEDRSADTGVEREKLQRIAELATQAPEGFSLIAPCSASSRGGAKWLQGKSRSTGGGLKCSPTAHWLLTAFPFA